MSIFRCFVVRTFYLFSNLHNPNGKLQTNADNAIQNTWIVVTHELFFFSLCQWGYAYAWNWIGHCIRLWLYDFISSSETKNLNIPVLIYRNWPQKAIARILFKSRTDGLLIKIRIILLNFVDFWILQADGGPCYKNDQKTDVQGRKKIHIKSTLSSDTQ